MYPEICRTFVSMALIFPVPGSDMQIFLMQSFEGLT